MRVALVCSGYPPAVGGIERHVAAVARLLGARGHEVEVLTQTGQAGRPVSRDGAVTVRRWKAFAPVPSLPVAPGLWWFLRSAKGRYDVIHAHNYHSAAPALAYLSGSRPLVLTAHMHPAASTRLSALLDRPYSRLFERAARVVGAVTAVSMAEAELLRNRFPSLDPVVIPNGVDTARFVEAAAVEHHSGSEPLILIVARLVAYKRVDRAIEALAYLPRAKLSVVGSGPELDALRARTKELNLANRVSFLGNSSDEALTSLYLRASLVVSLSSLESFGLVPLEALAAGARVVASDIPPHRELQRYDDQGALSLVDPAADVQSVAATMRDALAAGPVLPSRSVPTWEDVVDLYETIYLQVTKNAP